MLKCLLVQFATLFSKFDVRWPQAAKDTLSVFAFVNLDFSQFSPGCSMPIAYKTGLYLRLALPLLICVVLVFSHGLHKFHAIFVRLFAPAIRRLGPNFTNIRQNERLLRRVGDLLSASTLRVLKILHTEGSHRCATFSATGLHCACEDVCHLSANAMGTLAELRTDVLGVVLHLHRHDRV